MHNQLIMPVFVLALCARALPVTVTGGSPDSSSFIIEGSGTDVVVGDPFDTDDPGKTIFVPNGGATVVPIQKDPTVITAGGIPVEVTGGSDGVVVVPNGGATVVPISKDPTVITAGGIPVEVTGGSDGVVVLPGRTRVGCGN
ncbi:unnamed protein product [Discula destructiva]